MSRDFEDLVSEAVTRLKATGKFPPRQTITARTFANDKARNLISAAVQDLIPAGGLTIGEILVAKEVIRQELLFDSYSLTK